MRYETNRHSRLERKGRQVKGSHKFLLRDGTIANTLPPDKLKMLKREMAKGVAEIALDEIRKRAKEQQTAS